jgi:hypothetical protein
MKKTINRLLGLWEIIGWTYIYITEVQERESLFKEIFAENFPSLWREIWLPIYTKPKSLQIDSIQRGTLQGTL